MNLRNFQLSANTVVTASARTRPRRPAASRALAESLGVGAAGGAMGAGRNRRRCVRKALILLVIIVSARSGVNDSRSHPHHPPFNPPAPTTTRRNYCRLEKWEGFPRGVLPC